MNPKGCVTLGGAALAFIGLILQLGLCQKDESMKAVSYAQIILVGLASFFIFIGYKNHDSDLYEAITVKGSTKEGHCFQSLAMLCAFVSILLLIIYVTASCSTS